MTYALHGREYLSTAHLFGAFGEASGVPGDWAFDFSQKYNKLRTDIMVRAQQATSPGWWQGESAASQGAWQSVQNAMARCDRLASEIEAGDASKASNLLSIMSKIAEVWTNDPEEQKTWLDRIEEVLRGIPKNLVDATKFVAEQATVALRSVAMSGIAPYVGGAVALGLLGLYLWKR